MREVKQVIASDVEVVVLTRDFLCEHFAAAMKRDADYVKYDDAARTVTAKPMPITGMETSDLSEYTTLSYEALAEYILQRGGVTQFHISAVEALGEPKRGLKITYEVDL